MCVTRQTLTKLCTFCKQCCTSESLILPSGGGRTATDTPLVCNRGGEQHCNRHEYLGIPHTHGPAPSSSSGSGRSKAPPGDRPACVHCTSHTVLENGGRGNGVCGSCFKPSPSGRHPASPLAGHYVPRMPSRPASLPPTPEEWRKGDTSRRNGVCHSSCKSSQL